MIAIATHLSHRPRPRNLDGRRKNLREVDGRFFWHWDPARLGAAARTLRIPTLLIRGGQSDVLSISDVRTSSGRALADPPPGQRKYRLSTSASDRSR